MKLAKAVSGIVEDDEVGADLAEGEDLAIDAQLHLNVGGIAGMASFAARMTKRNLFAGMQSPFPL
jgi:hypothetical protein